MSKVRTRFAPSPTGDLHIGGARTALFSWAYAKANDGVCVLRIEDTDRERHSEAAAEGIIEGLDWLGLDDLEGPYYQSKRMDSYQKVIEKLLSNGQAYRCCCSKERVDALRAEQMEAGLKPRYDGCCRDANHTDDGKDYVIRFRTPQTGTVVFDDQVRGRIETQNDELDDLIIQRSDGSPTYNLSVVADDIDMQITHVIRGDDHINNTPRQIHIFEALGATVPVFAHVPSILATDGKKLSKRRGAKGLLTYREEGYLPEALMNYLIRLGWSHQDDEILDREAIFKYFDFGGIQRSPAALNPDKLLWLNQHYFKTLPADLTAIRLAHFLQERDCDWESGPNLKDVVAAYAERSKTLVEMAQSSEYIYQMEVTFDDKAANKWLTASVAPVLSHLAACFTSASTWDTGTLHDIIVDSAAEFDLKMGKIAQPVRVAVTGGTVSPSIGDTLYLLGQEKSVDRLQRACVWIESRETTA